MVVQHIYFEKIFFRKLIITFFKISITKSKIEEITIFQPPNVYVLLYFQHFPTKRKIIQILYIKETYILCNNIRTKRKDTKSLYTKKFNSITRV